MGPTLTAACEGKSMRDDGGCHARSHPRTELMDPDSQVEDLAWSEVK